MIQTILVNIIQILIGFAGGLAVGSGFVAFLTVLGIIPRLIQIAKGNHLIKVLIGCVIGGSIFGTYLSFTGVSWNQPIILLVIWGLFHGIFNGMLAAALTEVLNVFPIITKRIGLEQYLLWLLMAVVFGKIAGSLFQWLVLVK
ncbi:stage V sporulation protein AB [Ornithinibacillus sp. L9]|uniref:Stage V sporulation protein AB n=1 Tax=Ornithinibacillus caprae TaxID=2678566 RepID=A0A6N8FCE4_9BACI|nr:stage V sporulation protein AB [Ornithinibacillus caprae]MUK87220.1 stage V sporulation protein AB [Ornithinibacillus caprae]